MTKAQRRRDFRESCLERDGDRCVVCGGSGVLDVHHIVNRNDIPCGGYVPENGASLCAGGCHAMAEDTYFGRRDYPGYGVEDLFSAIGSSFEKAWDASARS